MRWGLACAALVLGLAFQLGGAQAKDAPSSSPSPSSTADWRVPDPNDILLIDTSRGRIIVELSSASAPEAAAQVRALAHAHFYDGQRFFRVIDGFMDQTGDPTNTGQGGSSLPNLPGEFTFRLSPGPEALVASTGGGMDQILIGDLPVLSQTFDLAALTADHRVNAWPTFCAGVVGMARTSDPASANSQFFLMRAAAPYLDQKYAAVGRVVAGQEVVKAIKTGDPVADPQDVMKSVRVLADLPAASRPAIQLIDPAGPWMKVQIKRLKADEGTSFSVCDLTLPSIVQ
ncbi:MAG: peptidylprolyl isomerase [Caulobacteraceae bacterium]